MTFPPFAFTDGVTLFLTLLLSRDKKRARIDALCSRCFWRLGGYSQRSPSSLAHSIRFRYVFAMLALMVKSSAIAGCSLLNERQDSPSPLIVVRPCSLSFVACLPLQAAMPSWAVFAPVRGDCQACLPASCSPVQMFSLQRRSALRNAEGDIKKP